jgi:hypothetical protein
MLSKLIRRASITTGLMLAFSGIANHPANAIVNGTPVTQTEQEQKGLVTVNTCSGVLIVNDWVLTAGHCVIRNRRTPKNIQVNFGGVTIVADAVYLFGGYADEVGPDIALAHLSAPFSINGSTTGFRTQIWRGIPEDLVGKTVASYGRGRNVCVGATGSGPYRAADFVVDKTAYATQGMPNDPSNPPRSGFFIEQAGGPYFRLARNASGQIHRPGDSGGPSFIFDNGTAFLVGIASGGDCVVPPAGASLSGAGDNYQTSLAPLHTWIEDVFKSQWTPGVESQTVFVFPNEVAGTKWAVEDVNGVHWAQAARAAAAMCYNRGFAGGHFDGHQGAQAAGSGFGIQCSNGDMQWFDVGPSEMDQQWRFEGDINAVNWAQAGRTAERICATRGFVGGQFNGHQRNGTYGLFCYRGGAQWFDATDTEIAATGWGFPTPRLDDNQWAQSARAATDYCRAKGFSGGFMNGHQVSGRYGIVCQKDVKTIKAQGRVKLPPGGPPPIDIYALNRRGAEIANSDPDAGPLRDQYGPAPAPLRFGFEVGLAAAEGHTMPGPGKQAIRDQLSITEQRGYDAAVAFSLERNRKKITDLAPRGAEIANKYPLAVELRSQQPDDAARLGFDIGMAVAEGQTEPGPGKQKVHDALYTDEQAGFDAAVSFSLGWNKNKELAVVGAEIAEALPIVGMLRNGEADALYRLGFDIATGIFGDPILGAKGNTQIGPGSMKIRDSLSAAGQRGFNAAMAFYLGPK